MKKNNLLYIKHILDAISQIEEYVQGISHKDFISNKMVQDAVIRQIEIIGEATKNLSKEVKEKYKDTPWRKMAGMRDKLVHGYFGVDLEAVWEAVEKDIPALRKRIKSIIGKEEKYEQNFANKK